MVEERHYQSCPADFMQACRKDTFLHFETGVLLVDCISARICRKWPIPGAFRSLSQSPGERHRSDTDAFRRIHAPLSQCLRKGVPVWLTDVLKGVRRGKSIGRAKSGIDASTLRRRCAWVIGTSKWRRILDWLSRRFTYRGPRCVAFNRSGRQHFPIEE